MKKKTVLTALLAAAVVLSLSVAALADFTQTITLTAPGEAMTVTVPTSVQLTLRQDETGTLKADGSSTVTNGSKLPIKVTAGEIKKGGETFNDLSVTFEASDGVTVDTDRAATIAANTSATVTYGYTFTDYNAVVDMIKAAETTPITVTYTVEFG